MRAQALLDREHTETWIGRAIPRLEDRRLLLGQGRFVDDEEPPGTLHIAFERCPFPHARVSAIDFSEVLSIDGVVAVMTGDEVVRRTNPLTVLRPISGIPAFPVYALATDVARWEGQPVCSIVATSRQVAEDALDVLWVEYEPLDSVTDAGAALEPTAPVIWPELGSNLATRITMGAPRAEGPRRISGEFRMGRVTGLPMETRAVLAQWDTGRRTLEVRSSTQVPHLLRMQLALALDIDESMIEVTALDVGGGFGLKLGIYPEDIVAALHAIDLGRPVKWIEDRLEHFRATTHAREAQYRACVEVSGDGKLEALDVDYVVDMGAYPAPFGPPILTNIMYPGPYRFKEVHIDYRVAVTNKSPTGAYRGYGQPESNFVREVLVDRAARFLGMDPVEFRRRNLLTSDELPYTTPTNATYDGGDYLHLLDVACRQIGYESIRSRQVGGERVGVGVAMFLEMTGYPGSSFLQDRGALFGAYESVLLRIGRGGHLALYTGVSSFGQGTETSFAQVAASMLGISPAEVKVHAGDTTSTPYNVGAFASRTTIAGVGAIAKAAAELRAKILRIAGWHLGIEPEEIEIIEGMIRRRSDPATLMSLAEVARQAYLGGRLPDGVAPGLDAVAYFDPTASAFGSGVAAVAVRVDPATGDFDVERLVFVHDAGRIINPMIVRGQILGGIAQGWGAATMEEIIYDPDSGQLINGNLVHYLVPTAADMIPIELVDVENPSPVTPLGVRGVGEAGTIPVGAALANGICDALMPLRIEIDELPITPERVWRVIQRARDMTPISCVEEEALPWSSPGARR